MFHCLCFLEETAEVYFEYYDVLLCSRDSNVNGIVELVKTCDISYGLVIGDSINNANNYLRCIKVLNEKGGE